MIAALILTYPTVLQQVMAFLRCDTLSGNLEQSRMLAEPSVVCGEGEHVQLAIAAWLILLLYGLGLPMFCFSLLWHERKHLNSFHTRCRLGLLGAEYEPRFFFWDAFILFRRFAATVAMVSAPAASRAMQLATLLALGLISLFIHAYYMPFDNRSGLLLDVMEAQALKLFCAACALFLFGFSEVAHWSLCSFLVLVVLIVHGFFLLRLVISFILQVQRSIADGVIDEQMMGSGPNLESRAGPLRYLAQRIFLLELKSQEHRAHVKYDGEGEIIEIGSGAAGDDVCDFERVFVAQGLAECIACSVTSCKVERLSTTYIEFIARSAFARHKDRLQCTQNVTNRLEKKFGHRKKIATGEAEKCPESPDRMVRTSWKRALRSGSANGDVFDQATFIHKMIANDFQSELLSISLFARAQLDTAFRDFTIQKGNGVDVELSTRDRLLNSVSMVRQTSNGVKRRPSLLGTNANLLGAEGGKVMSALPAPDERSRSDSYSLALPEFADSELDRIDPDMTSPEVVASTHSESKRQLPVADLDAPSLPQAVETSKDDDPSASGEENKEKPSSIGQISQSPLEGPPADTVLDIGEVVGAPESTESQIIASSAYVEDVSDNIFDEAIPSISEQNPLASIHQETQPQSEENPTNYADKGEPESSELVKFAESPPGAVEETSALPGSIPDAEIIGQPVRKSPEPSNALPTEVQPTFLPAELPT
jgi:hypothetical protein